MKRPPTAATAPHILVDPAGGRSRFTERGATLGSCAAWIRGVAVLFPNLAEGQ